MAGTIPSKKEVKKRARKATKIAKEKARQIAAVAKTAEKDRKLAEKLRQARRAAEVAKEEEASLLFTEKFYYKLKSLWVLNDIKKEKCGEELTTEEWRTLP